MKSCGREDMTPVCSLAERSVREGGLVWQTVCECSVDREKERMEATSRISASQRIANHCVGSSSAVNGKPLPLLCGGSTASLSVKMDEGWAVS